MYYRVEPLCPFLSVVGQFPPVQLGVGSVHMVCNVHPFPYLTYTVSVDRWILYWCQAVLSGTNV
jgi:hypothetical protein